MTKGDPVPPPSADLLSDLLGPLAIEGPPDAVQSDQNSSPGLEGIPDAADVAAIVPVEGHTNAVQVLYFSISLTNVKLVLIFIISLDCFPSAVFKHNVIL